ncbi:MAG: ATP-dependent DNA helicase [Mobilicoccus sp.]|nr:ATP-dependent DNA helicase [Mobilicoccus sp.]
MVAAHSLDDAQRAAVRARGGIVRVLGGPGTGKTTVAVHAVADRVATGEVAAHHALVLAPTRVAAARLRSALTTTVAATTSSPLVCSVQAFAYGVLRRDALQRGAPPPRLLSGPEQDVVLRELLAGHAAGFGRVPHWPDALTEAVSTRGFRAELRDVLMRAVEHGLDAHGLAQLAQERGVQAWAAAAQVLEEYDEVTALSTPGGYDPAWLLTAVADLLEDDAEALAGVRERTRLVVVDDAQELTAPGARLLRVLGNGEGHGIEIVHIGDPDVATQTFRGADPHLMFDQPATHTCLLGASWRLPTAVVPVVERVVARIGSTGSTTHRLGTTPADDTAGEHDGSPPGQGSGAAPDVAEVRGTTPVRAGQLSLFEVEPDAPEGAAATDQQGPQSSTEEGSALAQSERRPEPRAGAVETAVLGTAAAEARFVAARIRRAHLVEGVPWSRMAVIVRGAGRSATMRRVLAGDGIPVDVPGAHVPLRDERAVRPFLLCLALVLDIAAGEPSDIDAETVLDLLDSPLGATDSLAVRRLLRALRRAEVARAQQEARERRTSDELLVAAVLGDTVVDEVDEGSPVAGLLRLRAVVAAGVEAARRDGTVWAEGVTAETVLWAMWQASDLAEPWRRAALSGSVRADRDLDAVVALQDAAARYVDRLPQRGPDGFLEHVRGQDVAGDTLVDRAPGDDCVTLTTPAGAAGVEWDLVVVTGVQEGVWPDLRLRGSLLGSTALVDAVTGRDTAPTAARSVVRADETRLFLVAVSRTRHTLLVTAVLNEDETPSPFLDLVDPDRDTALAPPTSPMTLPDLVAALRRRVSAAALAVVDGRTDGPSADAQVAASLLARLAAAGVPGADPEHWWPLRSVSDDRPRRGPDDVVAISPSKVEAFSDCELRWLLTTCGGRAGGGSIATSLGTLVHDIAAEVDNGDHAALVAELGRRWSDLDLPQGWSERRLHSRALAMIDRLVRLHHDSEKAGWQVVGTEIDVTVPLGRAVVRGRVDRLEQDAEGRLRVVDLKTGSSKPAGDAVPRHPQLGAYQVAVEEGGFGPHGRTSAGAALMHIGAGGGVRGALQEQQGLAGAEDPQWAHRLLADTAEGMAGATFRATPGTACRVCDARFSCPIQPEGETLR